MAKKLPRHLTVLGLYRNPDSADALRRNGIRPVRGDLDERRSIERLAGLARTVLHFAPPPASGSDDPRTRGLLAALRRAERRHAGRIHAGRKTPAAKKRAIVAPARLLYISTSGVYGDCQGKIVAETRPIKPESSRAVRRAAAEAHVRQLGRGGRWQTTILRVPGIHGPDRLPLQRLKGGQPVMRSGEDSWGNHIDGGDLARAIVSLLPSRRSQRIYNVCDDEPLPMGTYLNRLAEALALPPLPIVGRAEAEQRLTPSLWSFQRESRRLSNRRIKKETRWRPLVATLDDLLERLE